MAIYSVYLPPEIGNRILDADRARVEFLPDTKSLWALIIPAIWLLWNRLWLPFGIYVAVLMLILTIGGQWSAEVALFLSGLPGFYLFLEGNELIRLRYEREGWLFDGILEAPDRTTAEMRYFDGITELSGVSTHNNEQSSISRSYKPVVTSPSNLFPE